jgi:predicted kinase
VVEDALRAMSDALRAEVATLRADRTLQGRAVTGGARIGTSGKRTTYAFPDVPGAGLPDDTPVRLVLDDGREVDGEVATRNDRELVVALAEDVGAMVEHAVLIADASFLLERLAARLDEVLDDEAPLALDMVARVLGEGEIASERADVPAEGLNGEQHDAVRLAVGSDATFVWGPPGTGKTTTVAHVVAAHARAGHSVLLVANTNTAVDTALRRAAGLLPKEVEAGRVLRHGTVVQPEVLPLAADAVSQRISAPLLAERGRISARLDATDAAAAAGQQTLDADHDLAEERATLRDRLAEIDRAVEAAAAGLLDEALVVATTVYQTWLGGLPERAWDVVVVDEASMLMLPMTAYAAGLASSSVVVAGDFRQLPAIVSDTSADVTRWLARDAFVAAGVPQMLAAGTPPPWLAALRTQYRMRPEIAGLVTDLFYADNPLATGRTSWPETPPLLWLDTSTLGAWAGVAGRGSRFNPVHAVLVAAYLSTLDDGVAGVVTPYAAQERLVAALLVDRAGPNGRGWVSTVHRFQGNEQDVVVVDLADAYGASPGPASRAVGRDDPQARLLNVAVSRARDTLLVLGDGAFLAERTPRHGMSAELLRLLRERGTPLPVEDMLRGAFALVRDDERVVTDLASAGSEVALFSPRVTGHGMARWSATLRSLVSSGVAVRVVTRPPSEQPRAAALLDQMRAAGVVVDLWSQMSERALVVDTDVAYVGGGDLGTEAGDVPLIRVKGSALPAALADLLRPARAPRRSLGEPTNPQCPACEGPTVLRRGGGLASYVCANGRDCPGLVEVADEDRDERPDNATGPCRQPGCAGWLVQRTGRYGTFTSCTRYPGCTGR